MAGTHVPDWADVGEEAFIKIIRSSVVTIQRGNVLRHTKNFVVVKGTHGEFRFRKAYVPDPKELQEANSDTWSSQLVMLIPLTDPRVPEWQSGQKLRVAKRRVMKLSEQFSVSGNKKDALAAQEALTAYLKALEDHEALTDTPKEN